MNPLFFIDSSPAFKSCDTSDISDGSEATSYQSSESLLFHNTCCFPTISYSTFLEEGYYYPMRLVYTNIEGRKYIT